MVRVRVELNQGAINGLVRDPRSPIVRHAHRVGAATTAVAKTLVGVDTGRLRQAIDYEVIPQPPTKLVVRVSANTRYAMVHHQGHGVIRPRRARVLAWRDKRGRARFARRVGPVPGNPFLTRAVQMVIGRAPRRGRG